MASGKWRQILARIAPALGSAVGGPFGGVAGGLIGKALLGKDNATEDEIAAAIETATPADFIKLRELDQQFAKDMRALDVDVFRLEVTDKASAREMFKVNFWPQVTLSALFVTGYFTALFMLMVGKVATDLPAEWQGALLTVLGVLTTSMPQILQFWFGSSFGSKEKTAALAVSTPANGNGGAK